MRTRTEIKSATDIARNYEFLDFFVLINGKSTDD